MEVSDILSMEKSDNRSGHEHTDNDDLIIHTSCRNGRSNLCYPRDRSRKVRPEYGNADSAALFSRGSMKAWAGIMVSPSGSDVVFPGEHRVPDAIYSL
jgi:hypothetical protein